MNRDHRVRRRVRDYMRDLGAYMHTAEKERLVYEGPVTLNFQAPSEGFVTLTDVLGDTDLAATLAIMLGAEREDGWLPDISTHARIVVEVLE
jgi:DNA topoisomerase IB